MESIIHSILPSLLCAFHWHAQRNAIAKRLRSSVAHAPSSCTGWEKKRGNGRRLDRALNGGCALIMMVTTLRPPSTFAGEMSARLLPWTCAVHPFSEAIGRDTRMRCGVLHSATALAACGVGGVHVPGPRDASHRPRRRPPSNAHVASPLASPFALAPADGARGVHRHRAASSIVAPPTHRPPPPAPREGVCSHLPILPPSCRAQVPAPCQGALGHKCEPEADAREGVGRPRRCAPTAHTIHRAARSRRFGSTRAMHDPSRPSGRRTCATRVGAKAGTMEPTATAARSTRSGVELLLERSTERS